MNWGSHSEKAHSPRDCKQQDPSLDRGTGSTSLRTIRTKIGCIYRQDLISFYNNIVGKSDKQPIY